MTWYFELVFYIVGFAIAFLSLWFVDFNKFVRVGKKQYALFIYIVLSLALGFIIGRLLIELGSLFPRI